VGKKKVTAMNLHPVPDPDPVKNPHPVPDPYPVAHHLVTLSL
jgi:hypothetical protein